MADNWKVELPPSIKWDEPIKIEEAEVVANENTEKKEEPIVEAVPTEWQGLAVRADGDQIFILKEGKRRWVTSPEAYSKLGFKFGDERKLDRETLILIPEGTPIK